jgi:hypothetical protein
MRTLGQNARRGISRQAGPHLIVGAQGLDPHQCAETRTQAVNFRLILRTVGANVVVSI